MTSVSTLPLHSISYIFRANILKRRLLVMTNKQSEKPHRRADVHTAQTNACNKTQKNNKKKRFHSYLCMSISSLAAVFVPKRLSAVVQPLQSRAEGR